MNTTGKTISKILLTALSLLVLSFAGCQNNVTGNKNNNNNSQNGSDLSANRQDVGKSAHDLLSTDSHSTLFIQMLYAGNYKPTQAAVDSLKSFLERRIHKPNGITINLSMIPAPGQSQYTLNDIKNIEDNNRTVYNKGDTLTVFYFFADGSSAQDSQNSKVLGLSYYNTSIVIFEKTIQSYSGSLGQPSRTKLEATVMRHEFGHILGLVNIGTPMVTPHEDSSHPGHCDDQNCLMYYNVNTSDVVQNILNSGIPQLDQNCLNDLKNNGGK
jgi:hypothetical protein